MCLRAVVRLQNVRDVEALPSSLLAFIEHFQPSKKAASELWQLFNSFSSPYSLIFAALLITEHLVTTKKLTDNGRTDMMGLTHLNGQSL
jgi:hypothetical protein